LDVEKAESKPFAKFHEHQLSFFDTFPYRESLALLRDSFSTIFLESFEKSNEGSERLASLFKIVEHRIKDLLGDYTGPIKKKSNAEISLAPSDAMQ
jgi:hypothetical protein